MQIFIKDEYDATLVNNEFEFPSNIKQIGNVDDRLKIYIEDYAHMYIQQYSSSSKNKEKLAVLLGKFFVSKGQPVLLISGVIQSKYSRQENGMVVFSDQDWEYISQQKNIFFRDLDIIGWLHTQPGYGVFLNSADLGYHMENFNKNYQVLLLIDPIEKMDTFFIWNEAHDDLTATAGYFIYYDKNEEMQGYMVENRVVRLSSLNEETETEVKEEPIIRYRKKDKIKRNKELHLRKMTNMLTSVSAVLLIICFIMGANLIQNGDRISKLEKEILAIDSMYKNLVSSLRSDNSTPVFAGQDMPADSDLVNESDITVLAESEELLSDSNDEGIAEEIEKESTPQELVVEEYVAPEPVREEPIKEEPIREEPVKEEPVAEKPANNTRTIPSTYVVEPGDNLSYISVKFYGNGSKMKEIMEINGIDDPNTVYAGRKIKLP